MGEYFNLIILAAAAASLSNLIDDTLAPDMIFGRYGDWVRSIGWWGKPIGGCLICTNVWVSIFTYVLFFQPCSLIDWVMLPLFAGVSNSILKFIIR